MTQIRRVIGLATLVLLGGAAGGWAQERYTVCRAPQPPPPPVIRPPLPPPAVAGTGLPVFDAANTAVNAHTAALLGEQVANSSRQVQLQEQDPTPTASCWEVTGAFLALLDEVLPYGNALHYQVRSPAVALSETYPGFRGPPERWYPAYARWQQTSLDTMGGLLETVHYQLRPEQQAAEDRLLFELQRKTEQAAGNLDVSQTGNMITLQHVEEQRKLRQLLGAQINATTVLHAERLNVESTAERIQHDYLEAQARNPVEAYAGTGGYGLLGHYGGQRRQ
jgi:P-type conjugative transfer protein TrbJ